MLRRNKTDWSIPLLTCIITFALLYVLLVTVTKEHKMGMFKFTEEDVKRSTMLAPGEWYKFHLKEYKLEKDNKGADLHVFTAVVYGNENTEFNGVPVRVQYSEKAVGFAKTLIETFEGEIKTGKNYILGAYKGRRAMGRVEHKPYDGNMQNNIVEWRPIQEEQADPEIVASGERESF